MAKHYRPTSSNFERKYGAGYIGRDGKQSEKQARDVVSFAKTMKQSDRNWHFDDATKATPYKSFVFEDADKRANGSISITASGGYQPTIYVDGKKIGLRDPSKSVANWFSDANTVIKAIDKAIETRKKNYSRNKARREAAAIKRFEQKYLNR